MCERPQRGAAAWWGDGIGGICEREHVRYGAYIQ